MFRKITVPLDGSALAEQALGQAAAIARAANAEIDLVLVHQSIHFGGFDDTPWAERQWSEDNKYLEGVAAELTSGAGVPTTHALLDGEPAEMICRRMRDIGADLVVMTTHGRTGVNRAWLGSIADRVLRHASVPVLMLHPTEGKKGARAAHHLYTRILVPLDGSPLASDILPEASALAACEGARLVLLTVVQPVPMIIADALAPGMALTGFPPTIPDQEATARLVAESTQQLEEAASSLRASGTECEGHVVVADHVGQAILDAAAVHRADAIAMATRGRGASRLFLGSVADKVLRGSELPTLLFRPLGVGEELASQVASRDEAHA